MIHWTAFNNVSNPRIKNHTVVLLDGNKFLLFGGHCSSGNSNKTRILDINTRNWTEIQTSGTIPTERNGHCAVAIGNKMFVMGGWDARTADACSDMYQLDCDTWTWTQCPVELTCNMCFAFYTQGLVYIFRGGDGQNYHNDMYTIHPVTFELNKLTTQGTIPAPRANCAGVNIGEFLYIVGGWSGAQRYSDMYRFHIPSCTWESLPDIPTKLTGATLTHYRMANRYDYLVLCGGINSRSITTLKIYLYDINRAEWQSYTPRPLTSEEPNYFGRGGHCAISLLPDQPQFLIIGGSLRGGIENTTEYPNSTLLFDISNIEPVMRIEREFTSEFESFFNDMQFSDFRLHFKDNIIHVHRVILSARNDRFRTLLSKRWSKDDIIDIQLGTLEMEEVSFQTFYGMIRFIYTGKLDEETLQDPIEMLKLADAYMIPSLKQHCEVILKKQVTTETVSDILEYANYYNAGQLLLYCAYFRHYKMSD